MRLPSLRLNLREPFASGSHLSGALAAVAGAIYLLQACDGKSLTLVAIIIYGLALITVFSVSALLHGLQCSTDTLARLERLDYASIYFFIAGTYTPVCLFGIGGSFGTWLLAGEWTLAVLGIWLCLRHGPVNSGIQVLIYLLMGWAFVLAIPSLEKALTPISFNLLLLGGALYSIGALVFFLNWPSIFRTKLTGHDFWHVLAMAGSAAHYFFVVQVMT